MLWSDSSESKSLKGIAGGNYHFTVTDKNGCSIKDTAFIAQPSAPLKITTAKKDVACFGESTGEINLMYRGNP